MKTKIPFFRRFVIQNFPFIEADFDALTDYQLMSKIVEYLNKVIDQTNINSEAVQQLQQYVEHYFDNLDVQEEINNKLDEMAESGALADIIAQYLQLAGVLAFDTVSDMKNATNIVAGSTCRTLGYNTKGDGGGSFYKIRNITNDDTVDEKALIEISSDPENNLVAEFICDGIVIPQQFGAKGNGTDDDTDAIDYSINYASENGSAIELKGKYLINSKIEVSTSKSLVIYGSKTQPTTLVDEISYGNTNILFGNNGCIELTGVSNITFDNVGFTGTGQAIIIRSFRNIIKNCGFNGFAKAIEFNSGANWTGENKIIDCMFQKCAICIESNAGSDSDITGCLFHSTCGYAIKGGTAGFKIENNHDYSATGSVISGINTTFVGNYIDGWNKLTITGNSGFNITGNIFIGGNPTGELDYCIKFTSSNMASGLVSGNDVHASDSSTKYQNLCFIDISEVSYFTGVNVFGNGLRIVGKEFNLGTGSDDKIYSTKIDDAKINMVAVDSNATLSQAESCANGTVMAHGLLTISGTLSSTNVARVEYALSGNWLFIIKEDGNTRIEINTNGFVTASSTSAQSIEFYAFAIRPSDMRPTVK